jgi:putative PEP-CTERM system TPR-repeat lipoprotein
MPTPIPAPRLLLALILGVTLLNACAKEDPASLVAEARSMLATGNYKGAMIQLKNALDQDEANAEARYELGKLYLDQLDLASAEKEFRHAREAGYASSAVNPLIARALLGQGEFQRLLDELPAPSENSPNTTTLQALRATAELGLGHKEEARKALQRALQDAPDNAEVHLALAQLALADGDTAKALSDLEQALKLDPKHRDSLLLKGDLLRATGKPAEAAAVYHQVLQIAPHHTNARLALAGLAVAGNKLADARKEVDAALKIAPNNLKARYLEALIDFREGKTERARDHLAAVLKAAPGFVPALLLGGSIEYALGNLQTAETYLNKVAKAAPNNPQTLRLLATTQLRLGRPDDAARTLKALDPENSNDVGVNVVAGEIALAKKEWAKASAHFEKAAQASPESAAIRTELGIARMAQGDVRATDDLLAASNMGSAGGRADALLILTQLKNQQYDEALTSIAALEKKFPASPVPWSYRGAAYLGKKDLSKARESFERVLTLDPTFFPAAATLARLDLQDNQPAAAKARFNSILKADPKHLQAMLALADLSLRDKDEKTYLGWLEKAATANPQALQPRIQQSSYWLAKGDSAKALAAARSAVAAQPDNPAAMNLLGAAQLASKDLDNALGTYRKLVDQFPNQAEPRLKLAQVQLAMRQAGEARKSLQEAVRLKPDLTEAQLLLGSLEIQSGRYDEALKIAKQLQQKKPKALVGWVLEGDTAQAKKQYPAALAAYERAHQLAPSSATLIGQHQALAGSGRFDEGAKRLADWLATHPQDHRTRLYLAEQLSAHGQYKAAADHYLLLNQQVPGNVVVLNNLASALSEIKDRRALGFAEQALKLQPDNPAIMDTVGWILVQQGLPEQGIKHLQQALSRMPDAAEIQWHLAVAFVKGGNPTRARSELERLLAGGTAFRHEQEARELLRQLQGSTR